MMIKKKQLCSLALASILSLSACSKTMDCNINGEHIHVYVNDKGIERLIEGEKETISGYTWTEETLPLETEYQIISDNGLCMVDSNMDYIQEVASTLPESSREEFKSEYVYGTYWGYGLGYNMTSGKYEYGYGLIQGYHYEDRWVSIPLDEYTSNLVRDLTYKIVLYKIDESGAVVSKTFDSLDDVDPEYCYFKPDTLVSPFYSEEYHLDKNKVYTK